MKIVEIISQLSSGGAERFVVDLSNELSENNDVTLIVLRPIEEYGFYISELSPKVRVICMYRISKGVDFSLFFKLRQTIKEINPEIVHTHLVGIVYGIWAILTLPRIRFFHTVHNDAKKEAGRLDASLIRRFCFKFKLVTPITISKESHVSFVNFYGLDAPMIFNGRDIPENIKPSEELQEEFKLYRKDKDTRVLVCLARITQVKRQVMFAKIANKLSLEGYNFALLFIGSTKETKLVEEIRSYNCPNIHILGEKRNPLAYLRLSDAFCLCSSYEGMPISLIEAMGVGAIPVCTPVGGIVNVIENDRNGLLSTDLSEESYYKEVKKFLNLSPDRLRQLQEATRESYTPFSMKECAEKYTQLFSDYLINNK